MSGVDSDGDDIVHSQKIQDSTLYRTRSMSLLECTIAQSIVLPDTELT